MHTGEYQRKQEENTCLPEKRFGNIALVCADLAEHLISADAVNALGKLFESKYRTAGNQEHQTDIQSHKGRYRSKPYCTVLHVYLCVQPEISACFMNRQSAEIACDAVVFTAKLTLCLVFALLVGGFVVADDEVAIW